MSRQEMIAAAKAPIEGYNEKDWNAVRESVTQSFVYEEVGTDRRAEGIDEVLEVWRAWAKAFPDARATFETALVDGENVMLELRWRGTHTAPLPLPDDEIPATGSTVDFRACVLVRVQDGKVVSMRHYLDMLTMLSQLGVASIATAEAASQ